MGESLTERRRVEEEVLRDVNSCCKGVKGAGVERPLWDSTLRGSPGQLRASSRGNT
jgi:hypothetical protein